MHQHGAPRGKRHSRRRGAGATKTGASSHARTAYERRSAGAASKHGGPSVDSTPHFQPPHSPPLSDPGPVLSSYHTYLATDPARADTSASGAERSSPSTTPPTPSPAVRSAKATSTGKSESSTTPKNGSPLNRPARPREEERYGQPEDVPTEVNGHRQNIPSREHDPERQGGEEGDDPDTVQPHTPCPLPASPGRS